MALTKIDDRGLKTPIDLLDNEKIRFGTGNDLEIYHDGSNSVIKNTTGDLIIEDTGGNLIFRPKTGEDAIKAYADGAVELYYDGNKKFHTHSTGVTVTGYMHIEDGSTAIGLGNSDDLKLYHDSTDSYIQNITGVLRINNDGTDLVLSTDNNVHIRTNGTEEAIKAIANGAVELYHDGVKKCETHADGLHIGDGGNLDMPHDSSKIVLGASDDLQIYHDGNHNYIKCTNGNLRIWSSASSEAIWCQADGTTLLAYGNSPKIETISTGVNVTGGIRLGGNNTANEMDDYEEGTWNPGFGNYQSGTGSWTYASQQGAYTKIGRQVTAWFYVAVSAMATLPGGGGTGDYLVLGNLPFTSANHTTNEGGSVCINWWRPEGTGCSASGNQITGFVQKNTSRMLFGQRTHQGISNLSPAAYFGSSTGTFSASAYLYGVVTYYV